MHGHRRSKGKIKLMDPCVSGAMQSIIGGVTDVRHAFYVEKCNVENVMRFMCRLVRKLYLGLKELPSKNKNLRYSDSEGLTEIYGFFLFSDGLQLLSSTHYH